MESLRSWTDDIPICKQAGIGTANNEIYRKDGRRVEMHPMQNRYFYFRLVRAIIAVLSAQISSAPPVYSYMYSTTYFFLYILQPRRI